jgi:hypothetical protein
MNTRLIKNAIDEMDRVMKRGYARDAVPGMATLRSAPKPTRLEGAVRRLANGLTLRLRTG